MRVADILLRLPHMLLDPRGRIDRKGLLILAIALLALQAMFAAVLGAGLIDIHGAPAITIKLAFLWVAIVAASKRLHDLGRSAWWIAIAFVSMIVWGVVAVLAVFPVYGRDMLVPGSEGYVAALALNMVPILAATLWMHFARGETSDNRYGPVPDDTGFSILARRADAGMAAAVAA
ncbi:MAG: DUF805 domain-containing protein [Hyphomicrobiaceae bacterium]